MNGMEVSRRANQTNMPSSINCQGFVHRFFDYHGAAHQKFLPQGYMVNKKDYFQVMRRLRETMRIEIAVHAYILLLVSCFLSRSNARILLWLKTLLGVTQGGMRI